MELLFIELGSKLSNFKNGITFKVDKTMHKLLKGKPKLIINEKKNSISYTFGKTFLLNEYKFLGKLRIEYNNFAIIDITKIKEDEIKKLADPKLKENWRRGDNFNLWDNAASINKARKATNNRLIFTGVVIRGKKGPFLYAHYTKNVIDSIFIDGDCLFTEDPKQIGKNDCTIERVKNERPEDLLDIFIINDVVKPKKK